MLKINPYKGNSFLITKIGIRLGLVHESGTSLFDNEVSCAHKIEVVGLIACGLIGRHVPVRRRHCRQSLKNSVTTVVSYNVEKPMPSPSGFMSGKPSSGGFVRSEARAPHPLVLSSILEKIRLNLK